MNNECTDRDLLAVEPALFADGGFESQRLCAGADGAQAGTDFTSETADFEAAGVAAGMVLCVAAAPEAARPYEIVSVDSATALTLSVLRADRAGPAVAPPAGTGLAYFVATFAPQLAAVRATLCEKLRQLAQVGGVAAGDFADSPQFRRAVCFGALADIFVARAVAAGDEDGNWVRSGFYRERYAEAVAALRLARDADGDGRADQSRAPGLVTLRRA